MYPTVVYHGAASLNTLIKGIWLDQYASGARLVPTAEVLLYDVSPASGIAVHDTGVCIGFGLGVGVGVGAGVCFVALQFRFVPPFAPVHDHDHGPVPETELGVPLVQRFVFGRVVSVAPFELPQTPCIGVGAGAGLFALQDIVVPPFMPAHDHP